jgi:hypothetical protein
MVVDPITVCDRDIESSPAAPHSRAMVGCDAVVRLRAPRAGARLTNGVARRRKMMAFGASMAIWHEGCFLADLEDAR